MYQKWYLVQNPPAGMPILKSFQYLCYLYPNLLFSSSQELYIPLVSLENLCAQDHLTSEKCKYRWALNITPIQFSLEVTHTTNIKKDLDPLSIYNYCTSYMKIDTLFTISSYSTYLP